MVDGSLRNHSWYADYFKSLRCEFPKLKIAIIHVVAEKDTVLRRAHKRALQTGRKVPEEVILHSIAAIPEAVKILAPLCDFVASFSNNDGVAGPSMNYGWMYDRSNADLSFANTTTEMISAFTTGELDPKRIVNNDCGKLRWKVQKHEDKASYFTEDSRGVVVSTDWRKTFASVWEMQCGLASENEASSFVRPQLQRQQNICLQQEVLPSLEQILRSDSSSTSADMSEATSDTGKQDKIDKKGDDIS